MRHSLLSFITLFVLVFVSSVSAQTKEEVEDAIARKDIPVLVRFSNNTRFETEILDVLCMENILQEMTYEELKSLQLVSASNTLIYKFITQNITVKEHDIKKQITPLDLEQLMQYIGHFPERRGVVMNFLDECLFPNLKSLSYLELVYLSTAMPNYASDSVAKEMKSRLQEKRALMVKNVDKFSAGEKAFLNQIKYVSEQIIWAYFIESHKQLTEAYSKISMVSDDVYEAAYQYECLVRACFTPSVLRNLVQQEVDKYCAEINKARKDYAALANRRDYLKASFSVPLMQINSMSPTVGPLYSIRENRMQYLEGRENVNSGSGIIGWIFGGVAGVIAKGIGDWMAISGLVDCEYEARYKYVEAFHEQLLNDFVNYSNLVTKNLEESLLQNQKEYAKSIKQ